MADLREIRKSVKEGIKEIARAHAATIKDDTKKSAYLAKLKKYFNETATSGEGVLAKWQKLEKRVKDFDKVVREASTAASEKAKK